MVMQTGSRRLTLQETVRRRFCYELWNIGVVPQSAADIVANGITRPVHWLTTRPRGVLLADPGCLYHADGSRTLFAEALPIGTGRGAIWSAELAPGQPPQTARFAPLFDRPFHLSYPFPFRDEAGDVVLTMESWQDGCAALLRQRDGWRDVARVLDGRPVLDPTFWHGDGKWWVFCTFRDDGPDSHLHLFYASALDGPWIPHPLNPIVRSFESARPAGPLFFADGKLIRPAQDSSRTYGGAVVLNVIERLDETGYVEVPLRRLTPDPGPFPSGLHTFCPAGDVTLIDGKIWRFNPRELGGRIGHKLAQLATGRGR
jgi:hypothetical protein